ncbi:ABC transporter substrate-binding protein [Sporomusa acidovorans]|uniref:Vitamin B12-binding protein n=1 Tax=Sporomusa acidovorans (strain ATCC 49682 / DSM 3132 / Mol) TaxID=1123286 RepID=A0ABZ3JA86_SPOA4|nr:ABC transporter substrate-binding protein [Sporomusa acidovorans]OZC17359.1 high-affinity heme uptake system protein IsdE precursor [Sporomusa acidovorans DSM 3132]SDF46016.1 iron complex transport system substrate-binding protein [Sporomusa acidovorans]
MHKRIGVILSILIIAMLAGGMIFQDDLTGKQTDTANLRSVTDSAGRTVQIPARPQRVIVLNASNLDLYYAAGGSVVGKPATEALSPEVKEAVKSIPTVGTTANPSLEKLVALKPDLILGVNIPPHHNLLPVLEKAGIPILLQTLDNYQQILDTLRFYGELTGQPEQAAGAIAGIEDAYRKVIAKKRTGPAPKVLIVWGSTESFNMATPRSFSGDLLQRIGAENIADTPDTVSAKMSYVPLSMEYVAEKNPDVILLITHSSDEKVGEKFRNELAKHPAWQGLKAVMNNRVHILPYHLFAVNPGTRVGEALVLLEQLVYPEVAEP